MNKIPYLLFVLIFFVDYTIHKTPLPGVFGWSPELLSALLIVLLLLRMSSTKVINLSLKYVILFGLLLIHMIVGIVINDVTEGPIIMGLRYYLKFFPFFLLPIVFNFSDKQMRNQLVVIACLALLQLPLTVYQRFIEYSHLSTGDVVSGTLRISSILSIFLICCIFITLAFYLKKRLNARSTLLLTVLLFIPCTLNETKGSIVLLPLGVMSMLFVAFRSELNLKKMFAAFSILGLLSFGFLLTYNAQYTNINSGAGLFSFFSDGAAEDYLYQDVQFDPAILDRHNENSTLNSETREEEVRMPRIDRLIAPFAIMYTKPLKLFFGLGMGNVTKTKFEDWAGEYTYISQLMSADRLMMSLLLWEIGLGGVLIYLVFFYMIYQDAYKLSKQNNFVGAIAAGWIGVLTLIVIALVYKNLGQFNVIGYLLFYFSGYLAAARYKMERPGTETLSTEDAPGKSYLVAPKSMRKTDSLSK